MTLIPTHCKWENIIIDLCRNCKHVVVFESAKVNRQNFSESIRQHVPEGSKTLSVKPTECEACGCRQTNSIRSALAYRFVCPSCQKLIIVPREPRKIVRTVDGIINQYQHDDVCCDCGEVLRAALVNGNQVVMIVVPDPLICRETSVTIFAILLSSLVAIGALYWFC